MPQAFGNKKKDWSSTHVSAMSDDSDEDTIKKPKVVKKEEKPKESKKVLPSSAAAVHEEKKQKKSSTPIKEDKPKESKRKTLPVNSDSEEEVKEKKSSKRSKEEKPEKTESESEEEKEEEEKPKKRVKVDTETAVKSKKTAEKSSSAPKTNNAKNSSSSASRSTPKSSMTDAEITAWRERNTLTIEGDECLAPYAEFSHANFPDYLQKAVDSFGFDKPTPIQAQCLPLGVAGRDIIGIAETGSGKTLAYGLPAIMHIMNKSETARYEGPSVVILAPTRELAQQIEEVMAQACKVSGIATACIYGGMPKQPQVQALQTAEIIIATPGRLMDLMEEGNANVTKVDYLVLDEADRMLDMGFHIQINKIIKEIPTERQTLMYSATWPLDVQKLAETYFRNPIRITIGNVNLAGASQITQVVQICKPFDKEKQLRILLKKIFVENCKILIFMLYKKSCQNLTDKLFQEGWPVDSLHGDKSQVARDQAINNFKTSKVPILIATDVASRGLDIKDIKYVINVEMPLVMEDYVHRIGRTGRAGVSGCAYTLFSTDDKQHARQLVRIMQESNQKVDDELMKISENAPVTRPRKTAMEQLYGDYAKGFDADSLKMKPTIKKFD